MRKATIIITEELRNDYEVYLLGGMLLKDIATKHKLKSSEMQFVSQKLVNEKLLKYSK